MEPQEEKITRVQASRIGNKKRAHWVDLAKGKTMCGLADTDGPWGWTVWTIYLPGRIRMCMFCEAAKEGEES